MQWHDIENENKNVTFVDETNIYLHEKHHYKNYKSNNLQAILFVNLIANTKKNLLRCVGGVVSTSKDNKS